MDSKLKIAVSDAALERKLDSMGNDDGQGLDDYFLSSYRRGWTDCRAAIGPIDAPVAEADERAAFEAWYGENYTRHMSRLKEGQCAGEYANSDTQAIWHAWQARAALVAKPAEETPEQRQRALLDAKFGKRPRTKATADFDLIAPNDPVAAPEPQPAQGSVDTPELHNLLDLYYDADEGEELSKREGALINYIDAKLAEARGRQVSEVECGALAMLRIERERAEKAEEWRDKFFNMNEELAARVLTLQESAEKAEAEAKANFEREALLHAEILTLKAAVAGPKGFASWQDAATAERIRRVKAEAELDAIKQVAKSAVRASGVRDLRIEELEAAQPAPQAGQVPDGWKIVPVEPTEAMLCAMFDCGKSSDSYSRYAAALRAAPPASAAQEGK